jgi:hypothetical protein
MSVINKKSPTNSKEKVRLIFPEPEGFEKG